MSMILVLSGLDGQPALFDPALFDSALFDSALFDSALFDRSISRTETPTDRRTRAS
jgi:hypothetical protein